MTPLYAFTIYPTPQSPLHRGTNLTLRCKYHEVFLINGSFAASGLLLCVLEYAMGLRLRTLQHSGRAVQLIVFLAMSLPFQLCVLDYPFADYRSFIVPFLAASCCLAMLALAHKSWMGREGINAADCYNSVYTTDAMYMTSENKNFSPLLAAYRSVLYICTSLCIFSRDLPCWNNRFSKSKAFGTSVMDLGIGCFVVCLGTVGPTAIRPAHMVNSAQALRRCLRQSALLSCLGHCVALSRAWQFGHSGRFLAEWREYGVHWNAFYSLAAARLLGAALELLALPRRVPPLLAAAALAAAHEAALTWGLAELVLAPGRPEPHNRSNLIGQNREGLASLPGLLSLYLAGLQLGRWARDWTEGRRLAASAKLLGLLGAALAWRPLLLAGGQRLHLLPESRRLLNPAYCAWVLAFSCSSLLSACLILSLRGRLSAGRCLQLRHLASFDRAGLLSFLLSNLATGLFNLAADAGGVNREGVIGGGRLCFAIALAYSVGTHALSRRLCDLWRTGGGAGAGGGDHGRLRWGTAAAGAASSAALVV